MKVTGLLDELVNYVGVLERSATATAHAADRSAYTAHLAMTASMFVALHNGDLAGLRDLVAAERRTFGWGYLSDECGDAAEGAFQRFANIVDGAGD